MSRNDWLQDHYFGIGTQYYAAARFSVLNHIDKVRGLLFHYAIEMFLNGHLCLTLTDEERKKCLSAYKTRSGRHLKYGS